VSEHRPSFGEDFYQCFGPPTYENGFIEPDGAYNIKMLMDAEIHVHPDHFDWNAEYDKIIMNSEKYDITLNPDKIEEVPDHITHYRDRNWDPPIESQIRWSAGSYPTKFKGPTICMSYWKECCTGEEVECKACAKDTPDKGELSHVFCHDNPDTEGCPAEYQEGGMSEAQYQNGLDRGGFLPKFAESAIGEEETRVYSKEKAVSEEETRVYSKEKAVSGEETRVYSKEIEAESVIDMEPGKFDVVIMLFAAIGTGAILYQLFNFITHLMTDKYQLIADLDNQEV